MLGKDLMYVISQLNFIINMLSTIFFKKIEYIFDGLWIAHPQVFPSMVKSSNVTTPRKMGIQLSADSICLNTDNKTFFSFSKN